MTTRRYTAEEMLNYAKSHDQSDHLAVSQILRQAAKTAADVQGLVEALNDIQARALSGYHVGPEHLGDIAREALSKFRGES